MLEKILSRINGPFRVNLREAKRLAKNNPNDFLAQMMYKRVRNAFWLSYKFAGVLNRNLEEDYYQSVYISDYSYYNTGGFKCTKLSNPIFLELCDLWFPYYYQDWSPTLSYEGTYEQYDVTLNEGDVVLDVGANVGLFTVFASKKAKCQVYAFEPVTYTFNILLETIKLNGVENYAIPINIGLSNYSGYADINLSSENNLSASSILFVDHAVETEKIEVTSIDEFIKVNNIEKVDFIKADIEGSERDMLEGAKQTLKNHRPKLAICTYHLPDDKDVLSRIILDANPDYRIEYSSHKLFAKCC